MIQTEKMETRRSVMKKFEKGFLFGSGNGGASGRGKQHKQ